VLSAGAYVAGMLALVGVVGAIACSGVWVRRRWLPGWEGAPARVAEVVICLAALFAAGQVAGALTMLRPWPTMVVALLTAACLGVVAVVLRRRDGDAAERPVGGFGGRRPRFEYAAAGVGIGVVAVQWISHAVDAFGRGMVHPDTLWYHQPFAARFLQVDGFQGIDGLGYPEAQWFPFNGQLLHALAALPFDRDILSPILNLGWGALALVSAWSVGRSREGGPLAALAVAVVLGLPILAATQPGQASTDIACAALFLAAAALLLEGNLKPRPTAVAGLAAGMALATKVTVAVPIAILVVGVVVVSLLHRRPRVALAWTGAVLASGSFWFLRNWVGAGSPIPWFDIDVGPIHVSAAAKGGGPALIDSIGDGDAWRELYLPGLWQGLGRAWPLILLLAVAGAVAAVASAVPSIEHLLGITVLGGIAGHVVTPLTGGFSFVFNLRYLAPALLVGFALLARAAGRAASARGRALLATLLLGVVLVGTASPHRERVAAWPADAVLPAIAVAVLIAGVVALLVFTRARPLVVALAVAAILLAGWPLQRTYLRHRYVDAELALDPIYGYFADVSGARVALFGADESFPLFGRDLSNEVRRGDAWRIRLAGDDCRGWRRHLGDRYDHIVLADFGFSVYVKPELWVIADDPSAVEVLADDAGHVFRLSAPLDPDRCPPGSGERAVP